MKLNNITFDPVQLLAGILLFIGWYTGEISGILAWVLLLMMIKVPMKWDL